MNRAAFCLVLLSSMATITISHAAPADDAADTPTCEAGMVYDGDRNRCVDGDEQSLDDKSLMDNAKALAHAGRYGEAMALLKQVRDTDSSQVQTYLGFVNRKLGDLERSLAHYRKAIDLNPDNTLARSYMGQALLISGNRRAAMVQLDEIAARDGTAGRAYTELAKALLAKSLESDVNY